MHGHMPSDICFQAKTLHLFLCKYAQEKDNVQVHILVYEESQFARIKVLELGTGYNEDVFGPVKNIHVSNIKYVT